MRVRSLVDGRFDCDRMLAAFEAMAGGNDNGGFPLSRIVCDMDWATDHLPDFDALIEFEARVNEVWSRHDDVVVCIRSEEHTSTIQSLMRKSYHVLRLYKKTRKGT